jgi:Type II secretion system (T2SS), protein E, N-terminal domain
MTNVVGSFSEFLEVVRKNFGASDVRILSEGETPPPSQGVIVCELPLGQLLAVSFAVPPTDPHSAQRRLEMLVRAFESTLATSAETASVAPKARALHDELAALVEKAGALDALVIDAHSPAIWGGAYAELPEVLEPYEPPRGPDNVVRIDGQPTVSRATELGARARSLGLRVFEALALDPRAMALVPRETCEQHGMVPLFGSGSGLLLAMVEPTNLAGIYEAALASGLDVEPAVAPASFWRGTTGAPPRTSPRPRETSTTMKSWRASASPRGRATDGCAISRPARPSSWCAPCPSSKTCTAVAI